MSLSVNQRLEALERQLAQLVVRGKVEEIDFANQRARVRYGKDQVTGWLKWKPLRAGKAIIWWPLEVGEAVTVISPGDLSLGEIFPSSYQNDYPAPSADPDLFMLQFDEGAFISYQRVEKKLIAQLPDDGTTEVSSKGGIKLIGDTEIVGNVKVTETVTVDGTTHSKGAVTCDADISDKKSSMQSMRDTYNNHNHSSNGAAPPAAKMT